MKIRISPTNQLAFAAWAACAAMASVAVAHAHPTNASDMPGASGGACTDFSGHWSGSCQTNGQGSQPDTMSVAQSGCGTMDFGDQHVIAGGTSKTERSVGPALITTLLSADWNAARTELHGTYIMIRSEAGHVERAGEVDVSARLDAGRLVTMASGTGGTVQCVYEKRD